MSCEVIRYARTEGDFVEVSHASKGARDEGESVVGDAAWGFRRGQRRGCRRGRAFGGRHVGGSKIRGSTAAANAFQTGRALEQTVAGRVLTLGNRLGLGNNPLWRDMWRQASQLYAGGRRGPFECSSAVAIRTYLLAARCGRVLLPSEFAGA